MQASHGRQAMSEKLVSLEEARNLPPVSRAPVRPDVATLWRWSIKGLLLASGERVHLRVERIGRRVFTSPTWVQQFLTDTAQGRARPADDGSRKRTPTATRSPRRRQRDRAA